MKDLTDQVNKATEEQTQGSKHIASSTTTLNEMIQHINRAVQGQKAESGNVIKNLQYVVDVIMANSDVVQEMNEAVNVLISQVQTFKDEMGRFSI